MDKSRRRALREEIRAVAVVLRREWDPISGGADGVPADEYDSYAPVLVGMIERGQSDRAIAEHLSHLESDVIGVGSRSLTTLEEIARKIRAAVSEATNLSKREDR
jgi:hypothetical protein